MNNGLVVCEDEKLIVPEREENTEKEKKKILPSYLDALLGWPYILEI